MTFDDFAKFQEVLFEEAGGMNKTKGKEYANGTERFGSFNRLAERLRISREQVLWIYLTKHLDGIESRIVTGCVFSTESVRSRIVDAITYLTLLAGMLDEAEASEFETVQQNLKRRIDGLSQDALAEMLSLMPGLEEHYQEAAANAKD